MKELRGLAASDGIAIGPSLRYERARLRVERYHVSDPADEWARFSAALRQAQSEVQAIHRQALEETGEDAASIFQFHLLVLDDPELLERVQDRIQADSINSEAALEDVGREYIRMLEGMENAYFRERSIDVKDIVGRLIRILLHGDGEAEMRLANPAIVIAADLTPSDTIRLDKTMVLGFCIAEGGPASHTAILARELGLPAVVGFGRDLFDIGDGSLLVLDGHEGLLIVDPEEAHQAHYRSVVDTQKKSALAALEGAHGPALTQDGKRIEVDANIGDLEGARNGLRFGADGIGLLRTEFLYLDRSRLPTEAEQFQAYREIAETFRGRSVILRTLDIGGDKDAPYLNLPREENPFLGRRGIRLCLERPDLFEPQLRAALRVMASHDLRIMLPMVTSLTEVRTARSILERCRQELVADGKPVPDQLQLGIMVEVPAAAVVADQFASEVDFFSIGTNDLSQYLMAADRTNSSVAALADSFCPALLRLVRQVVRAAHNRGKRAGMCGELAADPVAIPVLVGLGVDEFSMNPRSIPRAKQIIRSLSVSEARLIANAALRFENAQEIRNYIRERVAELRLL